MSDCDSCFKQLNENDNIYEDEKGNYICLDCLERKNEMYYNLYHKD